MSGDEELHPATGGAPGWDPAFCARSRLYWPLVPVAAAFASYAAWPPVSAYEEALATQAGVHFRVQPPKPRRARRRGPVDPSALYDARIADGWVPTRSANWHDFFNALVWATFPASKRVFHERQRKTVAARIEPDAKVLPKTRTREQDGLAILDEGSLLLLVTEPLVEPLKAALDARDEAPIHAAITRGEAVAMAFGHALYESLLVSREKPIWAMVVLLPCPSPLPEGAAERIALADARLSERIDMPGSFIDPKVFRSLPLDERLCSPPT
jgi:hypothetical protein